ncbi:PLDc N-terminal domain-containing protein [Timonella sp. A28]|uniref:PLDc N-terminal domain-containing protein n=1 Tax=Timonella sp. A28 TaxID=3442640 RepID=UPI003EB69E76
MEFMFGSMIFFMLLIVASVVLIVVALIDMLKTTSLSDGMRIMWALLIVLISPIGPILWFVLGKSTRNFI